MNCSTDLLHKELRRFSQLLAVITIAATSGFLTYYLESHGVWQQWTYLLHTLAGIFLAILLTPYIYIHFKRTLGIRRASVLITGFLSVLVLICLVISGLHISIYGQQKSLRWVSDIHIICAYLTIITLIAHLCAHRFIAVSKRRLSESSWFPSITPLTYKSCIKGATLSICTVSVITLAYSAIPSVYIAEIGTQRPYYIPFIPGYNNTLANNLFDTKRALGSDRCGSCHEEIANQWRASMHSQAASDISYKTTIGLLAKKHGETAISYCDSCHLPPSTFDKNSRTSSTSSTSNYLREGVSCMSCHGINHSRQNDDKAEFIFKPANDYLFANRDTTIATKLHNYLIRIQPRQHRIDMLNNSISESQFCGTCHTQHIQNKSNNFEPIIVQDELNAWLKSPFSGHDKTRVSNPEEMRCQDCHMPLISGHDPSASDDGLIHSHRAIGANTAIPWHNSDEEQLRLTTEFLQTDKIRISIEEPSRVGATRSRTHVSPIISTEKDAPAYYYLGETANLEVIITSSQVGHDFPGGTTDIGEVWIELSVVDAQNNLIYKSGGISDNNKVDPDAHFYRSTPIDSNGNLIWRHDLFSIAGYTANNTIASGTSDVVTYAFEIPSWVKGPLTASAVLRHRKFNNDFARWAFKQEDIQLPITDLARNAIAIPIRIKHEISK